jgi:hypothetical protein
MRSRASTRSSWTKARARFCLGVGGVDMIEEERAPSAARNNNGIHISVPFAWIAQIWARGLELLSTPSSLIPVDDEMAAQGGFPANWGYRPGMGACRPIPARS